MSSKESDIHFLFASTLRCHYFCPTVASIWRSDCLLNEVCFKGFFGGILKVAMSSLPFGEHLAREKRLSRMRSLEFSFLWSLFSFIAYDSTDKKSCIFHVWLFYSLFYVQPWVLVYYMQFKRHINWIFNNERKSKSTPVTFSYAPGTTKQASRI